MEISYDEFYDIHRPMKSLDLIVRSKRVLIQIKRKFRSKRSFIFVSGKHGYGKHEILNILAKENNKITLVQINDDSTVNSIERKNEVNFDMTGFLNKKEIVAKQETKREIFVIEEEVIKSSSCISIMNALMKVQKQCIFLYTCNLHSVRNDRQIKQVMKHFKKKMSIICLYKVPIQTLMNHVSMITQTHSVLITKRACCNLARNVYGNIRVLLLLVYRILVKIKTNNKNMVTTPLVFDVLKQNGMDGFTHFNDLQKRFLNSTGILSYTERVDLCLSQSYATKMYCYNSVIKKSIHPWSCNKLNMNEIMEWTNLFCINDIMNNYKSHNNSYDYDDFTLPLFLLM